LVNRVRKEKVLHAKKAENYIRLLIPNPSLLSCPFIGLDIAAIDQEIGIMSTGNEMVEQLKSQFESCWMMLRQAINNVPEENWYGGLGHIYESWVDSEVMNIWYYSYVVLHLIESVEFYSGDDTDDMVWGRAIGGIDWKNESPHVTASRISKEDMLKYLKKVESSFSKKLSSFSDEDLLEADGFAKSHPNRFSKYMYLLRHTMYHIGELARVLRICNCERLKWESP
jgi:hypothetical protein